MANELIKHLAPSNDLSYLPDPPNDIALVKEMDTALGDMNEKLFTYPAARVCSYEDGPCDKGCQDTIAETPKLDPAVLIKALDDFVDHVEEIKGALDASAGEQMVDRLREKFYSNGGRADLDALIDATGEVKKALAEAVAVSNASAGASYAAFRGLVKQMRDNIAAAAPSDLTEGGGISGFFDRMLSGGIGAFVGGALTGGVGTVPAAAVGWVTGGSGERPADWNSPDAVDITQVNAVIQEQATAIETAMTKLNDAVDAWVKTIKPASEGLSGNETFPKGDTKKPLEAEEPETPEPLAPAPVDPIGSTPSTPLPDTSTGEETPEEPGFWDTLKNLGGMPEGTGSPFGGMGSGIPSMGGGSPLGGGGSDPFGSSGLADALKPAEGGIEDEDKEPLEPAEGGIEGEDKEPLEPAEGGVEDENVEDVIEATPAEAQPADDAADGDEAPVTAEASVAPAAAVTPDPNSPEARTVTLPDGRQVEFPDARTAEMVKGLLAADPSAPTTVINAADQAGFQIQPMGQDIGTPIPPSDLRPGDVIVSASGTGVFIGNGEVLMENQEVKPFDEVSSSITLGSGDQGMFRMIGGGDIDSGDTPAGAAPSAGAVEGSASPVTGGDTETPTSTVSTVGEPESDNTVPASDTAPVAGTEEGALGISDVSEESDLDPSAAAF